MKIYLYYYNLFVVVFLFTCGCSEEDVKKKLATQNEPPLEYSKKDSPLGKIDLKLIGSIGSDDEEEYVFGNIQSIDVDNQGNLYVLDRAFKNIRVFNQDGLYLLEHEFRKGEGPGEFLDPVSIAVAKDSNQIYISDMGNRRLTIFTQDFNYKHSFPINTFYFDVVSGPNKTVIAFFYQLFLRSEDLLIHIFDETGKQISEFCSCSNQRRLEELQRKRLQGATYGFIAKTDSLLFLSFGYPYEIRIFDIHGNFVRRFARETPFYGNEIIEGEFIFPSGKSSGISVSPDSLILHLIYEWKTKETFIHAFDFDGKDRGTIRMSDFKIRELQPIISCATYKDYLYLESDNPYPRIVKFKIIQK